MVSLRLLLFVGLAAIATATHKICVPLVYEDSCKQMVQQAKSVGVNMECVPARDRVDCIYKLKAHVADFQALEPEDMYIASSWNNEFTIFKEIRTKEEPKAEFRYEAVVVIHKDLNINNVKSMKGLKSCHTGVGRNVGYKIPITKLTKMGLLGPLNDNSLSPRENELKALSSFFSKSCLVGKWSPHPDTNAKLKQKFSNLCELCEDPEKCDYPDANSGYEGALRCLAKAGGQVAFTKVIYVRKFFGMPYGSQPAKPSEFSPEDFAYLCQDGSRRPITGTPCTWAARPWPGFMASTQVDAQDIKELSNEIAKLNNLGETSHADWIAKVLTINNKTLAVDRDPISPLTFLENAKYKDVIERDVLEPRRVVRICTKSQREMEKCELLKVAAYSRDIRPMLSCVQKDNCVKAVGNKEAELVVLDPHQAIHAEKNHLKPLLNEQYNGESKQDIVAAIKKGSKIGSINDLRGKKACVLPNDSAGFFGLIKYLLKSGIIAKTHCPYEKTLSEFFSKVLPSPDPIKCLQDGLGDVAFIPLSSLHQDDAGDVELICPSGGLAPITKTDCGLITIPPKLIMTCKELSEVQIDEARQSLLSAANLFGGRPDLYRMFGPYDEGEPNVIFSDHATGMVAISDNLPSYEQYKKLVVDLASCNG